MSKKDQDPLNELFDSLTAGFARRVMKDQPDVKIVTGKGVDGLLEALKKHLGVDDDKPCPFEGKTVFVHRLADDLSAIRADCQKRLDAICGFANENHPEMLPEMTDGRQRILDRLDAALQEALGFDPVLVRLNRTMTAEEARKRTQSETAATDVRPGPDPAAN